MLDQKKLLTIKEEISCLEKDFNAGCSTHKAGYLRQHNDELAEFYGAEEFPDNYEVRYSADIIAHNDDICLFCLSFHLGDFKYTSRSSSIPYERYVDRKTAEYMYSRLTSIGLWNNFEPVRIDCLSDKLFPETKRKRIADHFCSDLLDEDIPHKDGSN